MAFYADGIIDCGFLEVTVVFPENYKATIYEGLEFRCM